MKAYVKNHFSNGISSVTTSQYPLLPPQPEPTPISDAEKTETESASVTEKETVEAEPVTDVVDEQVGSGEVEPVPTPAAGGEADHPTEEVTEQGGVEQVDEELKELKVETEGDKPIEASEGPATKEPQASGDIIKEAESSTPQVTEETTDAVPEAVAPVAEPRKQERVENPTFTLETVGNKYNTGNFW